MIDRILAGRSRFPRWVNAAIDHVADHPTGMLGRLAARRLGRPLGQDQLTVSAARHAATRVLIAPVNYSNQGRSWAAALEAADPRIAAVNMAMDVPGGFDFPADLVVPVPVYHNGTRWQRRQLEAITAFTHVLVEAREPLVGRLLGRDSAREVEHLVRAGVSVAYMCHGTEVRLPSRHRESTPWSPYLVTEMYVDRLERTARGNREVLEASGLPVFVSTPDLLADIPFGTWCPVVVDPAAWSAARSPRPTAPLRVVHAPSSASMKGTTLIEPVLERLSAEGVIDYRPISGIPSREMPEVYGQADIVLDQFRLGSYGVAACEAMASGSAVIGHVLDSVRSTVESATGVALPIIEATPDTLEAVLRRFAEDREGLAVIQAAGRDFVSSVHDGRTSARVLIDNWIDRESR